MSLLVAAMLAMSIGAAVAAGPAKAGHYRAAEAQAGLKIVVLEGEGLAVRYGDLDAVKKAIRPETGAIIVEPVQGEGGVRVPPPGFLRALRELQAMPWLLRPMLVRSWFDGARALTDGPLLHPGAADALRLSCVLLDSPVPPELGQQYIEVEHKEK